MELTGTRYQIGQRLRHPQFGEGLVVEVHTDRGREMLEVVFEGQLRRLSAQRDWEVVNRDDAPAPASSVSAPTAHSRDWHPQGDTLLERWQSGDATAAGALRPARRGRGAGPAGPAPTG